MANETLLNASVVINSPLLEVFDYVADPKRLREWVPFYSEILFEQPDGSRRARVRRGDSFVAKLSMAPTLIDTLLPKTWNVPGLAQRGVEVCVDDLVHGRRIAYRSNVGWTTICDFESSAGRTILTTTHSLWSMQGLMMTYWMGPLQAVWSETNRRILDGLKRRLEGRALEPSPKIFFSYRRKDARYVGGRIYDALTSEFGSGTVFRDSTSLLAGGDWAGDIEAAIRGCRVVVVHIGDDWEDSLIERMGGSDGLRDELEVALEPGSQLRLVPVVTSENDEFSVAKRIEKLAAGTKKLGDAAPGISKKFTARLQVQRLREDPDFAHDLEQLMRAVWNAFREEEADRRDTKLA